MRSPLVLVLVPLLLNAGCDPDVGIGGFPEAETTSSSVYDTGQESTQADVGVLSSGTYLLNTTEEDWTTDTCGVASHVSDDYPIEVKIKGSSLTIFDIWSTDDAGIQDDGRFAMEEGLSTTDEYGKDCHVTFTITEGTGRVLDDDHFDLVVASKRTEEGDCTTVLTGLDTLPCEEMRTWHLAK